VPSLSQFLLVRLQKEEAQPEHAWPAPPAVDQRPAFRLVQREMAQDCEPVRVLAGRLDRDLDVVGVPSGRMEHGCVDPALAHLFQTVLSAIAGDLPMLPGRRALRPDMDLCVDDQHGDPRVGSHSRRSCYAMSRAFG
jgi:hypothetical protein